MTQEREILQISLGSPACKVTSHLLNLQGLAATTAERHDGVPELPVCRAAVTHSVAQQLRVPRALLIDAPEDPSHRALVPYTGEGNGLNALSSSQAAATFTWSGKVEPLSVHALSDGALLPPSSRNTVTDTPRNGWRQTFLEQSSLLALSEFSRYRVDPYHATAQTGYAASSSNSRHVDWDSLGNEEEEEESETERRDQMGRQRRKWHQNTLKPTQSQLELKWDAILQETSAEGEPKPVVRPDELLWTDYLAPPLHPRSILTLPMLHEDAYFPVASGKAMGLWVEDEVLERIRSMLEDCDSCQGCVLSTSGYEIFAGLSTQILHYLHDECPSASRIVLSYDNSAKVDNDTNHKSSDVDENWRSHYIEATRGNANHALAFSDFVECSHALLPLNLPVDSYPSAFHASAAVATALEASTLPLRVRPSENLRIGTNSYYFGSLSSDSDFGTVPNLSMAEFLGIVKPRERLSLLELDIAQGIPGDLLWQRLKEGSSVERDCRMKESPHLVGKHRPIDVLPGRWMLSSSEQGGLMTSLSSMRPTSRTLHAHFALASAVRTPRIDHVPLVSYVDTLIQGMGVRYRPEQSLSTVLHESVSAVTSDGYGAGSYWKSAWGDRPILAVVGNTTRAYPAVHQIASNLKKTLSPRWRGFYSRDVSNGILPEMEDCQESLSSLWDLRDVYQPPEGSGLVADENDLEI
jgi:hypothetical protein